MGKGDKKSRRGKISMGTFGVRRQKKRQLPVKPLPAAIKPETKETETVQTTKAPKKSTPKPEAKVKKTEKAPAANKKS
jgi:30S ribosomal protein S31